MIIPLACLLFDNHAKNENKHLKSNDRPKYFRSAEKEEIVESLWISSLKRSWKVESVSKGKTWRMDLWRAKTSARQSDREFSGQRASRPETQVLIVRKKLRQRNQTNQTNNKEQTNKQRANKQSCLLIRGTRGRKSYLLPDHCKEILRLCGVNERGFLEIPKDE